MRLRRTSSSGTPSRHAHVPVAPSLDPPVADGSEVPSYAEGLLTLGPAGLRASRTTLPAPRSASPVAGLDREGRSPVLLTAVVLSVIALVVTLLPSLASASGPTSLPALGRGYAVTEVPASGNLQVTGRAWGHRIGMSQVGAQYAASIGRTSSVILRKYYPGTRLAVVPRTKWRTMWPATTSTAARPVLRVRIESNTGRTLTVTATKGLALWRRDGVVLALPKVAGPVARWRLVPIDVDKPTAGLRLQAQKRGSTAWVRSVFIPLGSGFVGLRGSGVRMELPDRSARVEPEAVVLTTWAPGQRRWIAVSRMDPQTYLRAVVPAEIGSRSAAAALEAQAVAARTYATRLANLMGRTRSWDTCDSTMCQFYPGMRTGSVAAGAARDKPRTFASTDAAIATTKDRVLLWQGKPALTMFSASNGGYSVSGGVRYLPAKPDAWDVNSRSRSSRWTAVVPVSVLQRFVPRGYKVVRVATGGRDGHGDLGGVASKVVIDSRASSGALHRTVITPRQLGRAYSWPANPRGLRSAWYAFLPTR